MNLALAMERLDRETKSTPFQAVHPDDLSRILADLTANKSPRTADAWATHVRAYYRWLHDDELPKTIRRAMKRKSKLHHANRQPVTEAERDSLLGAARDLPGHFEPALMEALICVLWDSGFRIGEALALRVGSFNPKQGGAELALPDVEGLKTGPRTIFVSDCVAAFEKWLTFHPSAHDPEALLFPSTTGARDQREPYSVHRSLTRLCRRAELRPLHPHLFRHSRATRAAEAGWVEAEIRAYFGWARNSDMPSTYIHLKNRTMEAKVRRDSSGGAAPAPVPLPPPGPPPADSAHVIAQAVAMAVPTALAELVRQLNLKPSA